MHSIKPQKLAFSVRKDRCRLAYNYKSQLPTKRRFMTFIK